MNTTRKRRVSENSLFARELSRAVAQRGRLDVVYQALSDHWTLTLQRLFPVWVITGPGLADPGHIELSSRTVYLDSDALLGTREEIVSGVLDPRRILGAFGVAIHETLHAKHTKTWVAEHDIELSESGEETLRQLAVDRRLLEEPRMEATGLREFPEDSRRGRFARRALAAAAVDIILPRLSHALTLQPIAISAVSRDMAGTSIAYLGARCHYVLDHGQLGPLPALWDQVLGTVDLARLDDLFARVIYARDGDNDALSRYAREYRDIIGPPPPSARGQAQDQEQERDGTGDEHEGQTTSGQREDNGQACVGQPTPQSLGDALEQALEDQRASQLEQLNEDIDLQELLSSAATVDPPKGGARATDLPTSRLPRRGVDRPPCPDEAQMAKQFARRLHQAQDVGLKRIDKRTPGGKFNSRAQMRAHAQRKLSAPVTARPWETTKIITAPLQEPHVGLVIDTSGSMASYEYALGPVAWVLSTGLREFGGKLAIALFGNSAALLSDGSQPLALVPGIRTGGGTAFGGDAIDIVADQLEINNRRRPRLIYVLSDGGWADTEAGVSKIRELRDLDVPTLHISIGIEPLAVECDRISVIDDPAEAMDIVGRDTVEALRARRRR